MWYFICGVQLLYPNTDPPISYVPIRTQYGCRWSQGRWALSGGVWIRMQSKNTPYAWVGGRDKTTYNLALVPINDECNVLMNLIVNVPHRCIMHIWNTSCLCLTTPSSSGQMWLLHFTESLRSEILVVRFLSEAHCGVCRIAGWCASCGKIAFAVDTFNNFLSTSRRSSLRNVTED